MYALSDPLTPIWSRSGSLNGSLNPIWRWLLKSSLTVGSKAEWLRLLAPAHLIFKDELLETLRANKVPHTHEEWPAFMWKDKRNPEHPRQGMLQSDLLVKTMRAICIGPSSANNANRSRRQGNAALAGIDEIMPAAIAHCAVQVHTIFPNFGIHHLWGLLWSVRCDPTEL